MKTKEKLIEELEFLKRQNKSSELKQKNLKKQLKKLKDDLAAQTWGVTKTNEAIKVLYKELEKKNEELKKIDQLKSDFISTVSHELRTPLTSIKNVVVNMLDGITGEINEKQKDYLHMANDEIVRLAHIIDGLLDISKIESGKVELDKTLVDITAVVNRAVALLEPEADKKKVKINTFYDADKPYVLVDSNKITRVFNNLIGNSLKFTPEGGKITVGLKDREKDLEIFVQDTGIGIALEDKKKVFEKFIQVGRTPGAGEKGTGLGLPICKELVKLHGGDIWVESELGKGTKFIFTLPKKSEFDYLKETLKSKVEQVTDSGESLMLVFIDIINLDELKKKLSNETFSQLYTVVRDMLFSGLRSAKDFIIPIDEGRIAGILITKEKDEALKIIDRLKSAVYRKLFLIRNLEVDVAISLGMTIYGQQIDNVDKMIEEAGKGHEKLTLSVIGKREIVVVDDETEFLKLVKSNLEAADEFKVYTYSKAAEALEGIAQIRPEVIITDIKMPEMNGYELVGRLYEYEGCGDIPVIFVTAYSFDEKKLELLKSKRITTLNKPFKIEELIDKINSMKKR